MKLLLIVISALGVATAGQMECPADGNSQFHLSVVSRRNSTGHWTAQVHFDHGGELNGEEPWNLELDHKTVKCGDLETVSVDAVIISPGSKDTKPRRPDYELIKGFGYYKMHAVASTWLQALRTCANEGTHLLILNSQDEVNALVPFFQKHPKTLGDWRNNVFYIGIHDYFADGTYMTIFSEPVSSLGYNKWSTEQTNPGERCGMVLLDGTLGDAACDDHKLFFICEQEL